MLKVKVTVPAVCTGFGAGLDSFGLALALHETLEFSVRADSQLAVDVQGEGERSATLRHPALRAAIAVFQSQERAPAGLNVTIQSRIPPQAGLNDTAALTIGGLLAANNLLDAPLKREDLLDLAAILTGQATAPTAALLGGLVVSSGTGRERLYKRFDVAALKAVIALPDLAAYTDPLATLPPLSSSDVARIAGRAALLAEAFRLGDWSLLSHALSDPAVEPARRGLIPGADDAAKAAIEAGAIAVTVGGGGPALIALAQVNHKRIEDAMQRAFSAVNIRTRVWTVNVDTQGVTVSVSR
jgi:homoserine kinase